MNGRDYVYWIPTYKYKISLIHPLLEIYRLKLMDDLEQNVIDYLWNKGMKDTSIVGKYVNSLIINTIFDRTNNDDKVVELEDGVFNEIPNNVLDDFYAKIRRKSKLNISKDEIGIKKKFDDMINMLMKFERELTNVSTRIFTFSDGQFKLDRKILTKYNLDSDKLNDLKISQSVLKKLKNNYSGKEDEIHVYILCCLIRYKKFGIIEDSYTSDSEYKSILKNKYKINFEIFATVFNYYFDNYCSLFYDVERYFGSKGNFMALRIVRGFYMTNFFRNEFILNLIYEKIKKIIKSPDVEVGFILSVPLKHRSLLYDKIQRERLFRYETLRYEYLKNSRKLMPPYASYLFWNSKYEEKNWKMIESLAKYFVNFKNYAEFPFKEDLYSDEQRIEIFEKLKRESLKKYHSTRPPRHKNIKLHNIDFTYYGYYSYLIYDPQKYQLYMLSDLFNDHCRVQCHLKFRKSPIEFYSLNRDKIIMSLFNKNIKITPLNIREEIYIQGKICSIHNPLIIKYFIEKFSSKRVLDFCAGWGDRLIGALLSGVDIYTGFDPNTCLEEGYKKIIKMLLPYSPNPNGKYEVHIIGFEKAELPLDVKYDLVYTSPPFFDLETYSKEFTQSVPMNTNITSDTWLKKFIIPSVVKCMNHLVENGKIVLYFSQGIGYDYIEKFIRWAKWKKSLHFLGSIIYSDPVFKSPQPIFIFQKSLKIPTELYNPPIEIQTIIHNFRKLYIIRDDKIIGGTKNRAMIQYIQQLLNENPNINELVYAGASNGYGQVAVSNTLYLLKSTIKLTIFYRKNDIDEDSSRIRKMVRHIYPYVRYIPVNGTMANVWDALNRYLQNQSNIKE
ncbi:MAG: hypothetical protein QXW79_00005, partial [Thermoplasmata archaeon]